MPQIKTSELIGPALDWAVAKCEGVDVVVPEIWKDCAAPALCETAARHFPFGPPRWSPSTDWAQGGEIIDREKLCVGFRHQPEDDHHIDPEVLCWSRTTAGGYLSYGPTPLIAAMRCYVATKCGGVVEIPKELLNVD